MTINALIEFSSTKDLYQNCWLTNLPQDYVAPTESEKQWLWKFVATQNYYVKLNEVEKQNLKNCTEKIETTIPMITSSGIVLNVYHKLYLSFLIAKLYVYKVVVPLHIISSIVIYPTFKLRKIYNESGLVICKGVNVLLKPIHTIYNIIHLLKDLFNITSIEMFLAQPVIERHNIHKTYSNWIGDLKYIESIINKKQVYFKDKIEVKVKDLHRKINAFDTEILAAISEESKALKPLVAIAHENLQIIIKQLNELNQSLPMLEESNKASIHLSWQAILQNFQNNGDLLTHEMAHLIDFYNGGLDGVPAISRKFKEVWQNAFEQEKQKQSFLNWYAFENELEFFAVCNEAFFKTSVKLRQNIPSLYDSLTRVYGYIPDSDKKMSTFDYLKLNLFSKISILKLKV